MDPSCVSSLTSSKHRLVWIEDIHEHRNIQECQRKASGGETRADSTGPRAQLQTLPWDMLREESSRAQMSTRGTMTFGFLTNGDDTLVGAFYDTEAECIFQVFLIAEVSL